MKENIYLSKVQQTISYKKIRATSTSSGLTNGANGQTSTSSKQTNRQTSAANGQARTTSR